MSTGVERWSAESFAEMIAMSPFVGSELILTAVVAVVWIVWQIRQIKAENARYDEQEAKL